MRKFRILGSGSLALAIGLLTCASAQATQAVTTSCSEPAATQPFLPFGDSNYYVPVPGESYDKVSGTGWTLSNGASLQSTTLYDGTQGRVLNLPKGAQAVTPQVCINNTYPYLRTMLHSIAGGSVSMYVSYLQSDGSWKSLTLTGSASTPSPSWALSGNIHLASGPYSGWNYAKLTFVGGGNQTGSATQLYNIYLDPRMKH